MVRRAPKDAVRVVDLFAGPGGWDVGARALGIDPLGLEIDKWARATRSVAGLRTVFADVAEADPYGAEDGLIASPPCPAFSAAGKQAGNRDLPILYVVAGDLRKGRDRRDEYLADCTDPSALLVVEPVRWWHELRPEWIALEQVPPVLDLWEAYAEWLRADGYSVWTGLLNAADYGVPQVRRRAFLMASRARQVHPPQATHAQGGALTFEGELQPWVTMAEALGWGITDEPAGAVVSVSPTGGPRSGALDGGSGAREKYAQAQREGRWLLNPGLTESQPNRRLYDPEEEPAPTIAFGKDAGSWGWERPATTIAGDSRVWPPGHKENASDPPGVYEQRRGANALRVTPEEAAALQGFPAGYPWQGVKTEQYRQIGNAVPPPLARAVLGALTGKDTT